ncbi:MAG: hypothetical protein M1833_004121 [Piccolia ochrophora]|nr:MAG: hypothetical protein M1833_004121 [Piccolia ochrophora]
MSLTERLDKIRSPNLQSQQQTAVVLAAIEGTLKDQNAGSSPTAYFAAILALLNQSLTSSAGSVNKELTTAVVYLLDVLAPFVPLPLLRSKFSQILSLLAPSLTREDAEAPLLKSAIGCLESLLLAQDGSAWALSQTEIGPRRAVAGLLALAVDHRPKVRKRALDALTKTLNQPPPSPALDHPAADMCAETSLRSLSEIAAAAGRKRKQNGTPNDQHDPALIHALQLVKTVATASSGWPSRKIEPLCEVLLNISKSSHQYLVMSAIEVFEAIFQGMADEVSSAKLPRLMEALAELRPAQNDAQLLPSWIAVLARGWEVSARVDPEDTFQKLPELFELVSSFLASSSYDIRVSASECLVSFMAHCVPETVVYEPSIYDEKVLEKLARLATDLLSVKYQAAWPETFRVLGSMFEVLRHRSHPLLDDVVNVVGELRGNDSFTGHKEADELIGNAVIAMGPRAVLQILPLNLANPKSNLKGRAWLLPILRDHVSNTDLIHFKSEFVPLSEMMYERVLRWGEGEKTMEIKIYETVVQQVWALLPGYCNLPRDLAEAFDQGFAELLSNVLYKQVDLRADVCRALQSLVESNSVLLDSEEEDTVLLPLYGLSKADAQANLDHLATYTGNLLAVLFNVYSQTLPQSRGFILECINAFLSITPKQELADTFTRVTTMLETSLSEEKPQTQADRQKLKKGEDRMPQTSHTFMDLIITLSIYLPREMFGNLFNMAALIVMRDDDPQLQKKAYKLIPRLAQSDIGRGALEERNTDLQQLIVTSAEKASSPARRDRMAAISEVVRYLPKTDLHFIPSMLSEVVMATKEVNEKARAAAFNLLVLMGERMQEGGVVKNSKIPHMADDAPDAEASLGEYFTMVSAGLAGSTPHMTSACITALTRIVYHFRASLSDSMLSELVSTLDLFLTSNNREIVRSTLGFVKVSVISLPTSLMAPRLPTLLPNLIFWSHEHKAHFKLKVKHIIERMIRRFGIELVEKFCPEDDRKLIANIRKSKERSKRKKNAAKAEGDDDAHEPETRRKTTFASEFDEALYGSDSSSDADTDDDKAPQTTNGAGKRNGKGKGKDTSSKGRTRGNSAYIVEDDAEPLDLLDRKSLANISTSKPLKARHGPGKPRSKAKMDADGKLVFGDAKDSAVPNAGVAPKPDAKAADTAVEMADAPGAGVDAYVAALKGKDAVQRGQRGRLKFSNRREKAVGGDEMDVDGEAVVAAKKAVEEKRKGGAKGGVAARSGRKGLGVGKVREGRVGKAGRGGGKRRP